MTMRKHSVRKWLHAILDLLPVILIPVFMIYSHRHTIDSDTVTREEPTLVNLQQGVINGLPNSLDNIQFEFENDRDLETDFVNGYLHVYHTRSGYVYFDTGIDYVNHHSYYFSFNSYISEWGSSYQCEVGVFELGFFYFDILEDVPSTFSSLYTFDNDSSPESYLSFYLEGENDFYFKDVQIFDLTYIFGSGNEPTYDEFQNFLSKSYYEYGVDNLVPTGTYHSVTYNDTDIMSQVIYQMYNATDKYFNMDKTFNLGTIHNWVNANLFSNEPPLIANIVWHIISYEFIMDLVFLVYAVFMFVIDFADRCLNSFFDKSFGGGR